MPEARMKEP